MYTESAKSWNLRTTALLLPWLVCLAAGLSLAFPNGIRNPLDVPEAKVDPVVAVVTFQLRSPEPHFRFEAAGGEPVPVTFRWISEGARGGEWLEIASGPNFSSVETTVLPGNGEVTHPLSVGNYFWRVRAGESVSEIRELSVVRPAPVATPVPVAKPAVKAVPRSRGPIAKPSAPAPVEVKPTPALKTVLPPPRSKVNVRVRSEKEPE